MAYTAKDQRPPTAFSVPKRNKKLEVGRKRRRRRKSPSVDPCYHKGMGKKHYYGPKWCIVFFVLYLFYCICCIAIVVLNLIYCTGYVVEL